MLGRGGVTIGVLAALTATLASVRPAAASPLELFGFGGRSPALAGTGATDAAGFDSTYLNPAGLADIPRKRLTLGYLVGDFHLALDGRGTGTDLARGLTIGAALPLPLGGALRRRVGLGVGIFVPTGTLARVRVPFPGQPVYSLLETRSQIIGILVSAGVRLGDHVRVGGGILALAALRGSIFIHVDAANHVSSSADQRLIAQYAPVLGAIADVPHHPVRVSLVLRGPSRSDYDIEVTNDLATQLPLSLPPLRIAGTAQYDPLAVDAEVGWHPRPDLGLHALLSYQRWSAFPLPTENPLETQPAQEPPHFHDTIRPHLGAELTRDTHLARVALRAGYAFVWTPTPESRGRQSLLDNSRHVFTGGVGLSWPGATVPLHLDAWLQLHLLVPRTHTKDPAAFDPGTTPPFDTIHTRGRIVVGGMTLGVDL